MPSTVKIPLCPSISIIVMTLSFLCGLHDPQNTVCILLLYRNFPYRIEFVPKKTCVLEQVQEKITKDGRRKIKF
jgi:hypothetical protein